MRHAPVGLRLALFPVSKPISHLNVVRPSLRPRRPRPHGSASGVDCLRSPRSRRPSRSKRLPRSRRPPAFILSEPEYVVAEPVVADVVVPEVVVPEVVQEVLVPQFATAEAIADLDSGPGDHIDEIEMMPADDEITPRVARWPVIRAHLGSAGRGSLTLLARAATASTRGAVAASPHVMRWLPRVAAIGILMAAGTTARGYWLDWKATPTTGTAVIESVPPGSEVLIDGHDTGQTPLTTTIQAGRHSIEFRARKQTRTQAVTMGAGDRIVVRLDWTKKQTGRLAVNSVPAGARVLVDGAARGNAPLTLADVAVGPHVVVLESPKGSVQRSVTVEADLTAQVEESIFPGWITVAAPFEVTLREGTRAFHVNDREQVLLPPGPHEFRVENSALGYQTTQRVEVRPGEVARLSVAAPQSTLSLTSSEPAEVWLDDAPVGSTPLVDLPVEIGTRELRVKSAAGERRLTATVTTKPLAVRIDF